MLENLYFIAILAAARRIQGFLLWELQKKYEMQFVWASKIDTLNRIHATFLRKLGKSTVNALFW